MKINGVPYHSLWLNEDGWSVCVIDQTKLPHAFEVVTLRTLDDAAFAIKHMQVRGAPLIGVTAAYGICLALREDVSDDALNKSVAVLAATRPTAVNLHWALENMRKTLLPIPQARRLETAYAQAAAITASEVETCRLIGVQGQALISDLALQKNRRINILTHCNAGWLACVDWGTALAPIYRAYDAGIDVHVWVDETRPRNQGASLTAYELHGHGVPHTIISDNAGGHLMQHGQVDLCIVGCDRLSAKGDAANKIGTYLKALAAFDNGIPFYVALPHTTIDWTIEDGIKEIPIEERASDEVTHITGKNSAGTLETVQISSPGSPASNPAFDVTPARLITGIITERGVSSATQEGLASLYPEIHTNKAA